MRTMFTREVLSQIGQKTLALGWLRTSRVCASWLVLLFCTVSAYAQSKITGRVIDDQQQGLPGVSVVVKGTTTGSVTDVSGNYSLTAPDPNGSLVFSYIGFTTQEVPIKNQSTVNITMATDMKSLNEVVVVGYGTQRKETITGSVVAVKGADLVKSPTTNLSNSLAGRLPGVTAVNRSGEPGADGSTIRIRGTNTLGNNSALVVVDGIPDRAGGLDRINPADIETISVLKDASAAIYGSRAANGVILITTKRGKTGKPQLSYTFNQGFAQPTVTPKLANAAQYATMLNDLSVYELPVGEWGAATKAYQTTGSYTGPTGTVRAAPYTPDDIAKYNDGSDPWGHPNTDWYASTLKTWSPQSRHNLQLTGGSEDFKYLASLGYQNQDAFYKNSATGYQQYDMRINLDANISKNLHLTMGVLGREEYRFYPTRGAGAIFRMQMRGKPNQPAFWPDGRPGPDIENGENPVVITTNATGYDRDKRDYIQTNGQLDFKVPGVDGLKFSATAAIDKLNQNNKRWETPWTLYERGTGVDANGIPNLIASVRGPAEPRLTLGNNTQLNILLGGIATYERKIGNHGFTFLAGINRETITGDNFNAFRRYFISPSIDQLFAGGDLSKDNGGGAFNRARLNYFGRIAYNYKDKYLLEFLGRYDGSDIFPKETRYGFFPGVMGGWVISEENFWKNSVPAVNYFKLRASWGQLGNDQIYFPGTTTLATYQYLATYGFNTYIINDAQQKSLLESRIPNTGITWEVANNADIGLEGQLFNGKISFEFDYFNNLRTSILYPRNASVPRTTGLILPPENIGRVRNSGFDGQIGYNGQSGALRYSVSVNGGYAQNKILFWDEAPGAPEWQRSTGRPVNSYIAYQYDGVFKDQADIDGNTIDYSAIVKTIRPGDMKYKDYNGDGKITPDDQVRNNRTNLPLFQGGINMTASYKNFDLTILFQGSAGAQQYISLGESGNIGNYLAEIYTDRWTVDNPSSVHPRIANRSDQYFSGGNTYWLRSADYLRLKNFEVGYTIPETFGKKIGISSLRVYVNGLNLVNVFNKLGSFDPEADNATGQYYPQSRIINTGLSLRF
ncbi:SusC/RagA family TonB-linked outer membrane protein [Spirosoma utsteinense]|uniref:TonB-linked SusC/RagA family outer membrane protein n=1 Tax=Spirosoma utsteinense TaxID=2585773 RepID=A0ABR6W6Q3_9BACT|nr:TonB-dependent receptor [Spirosoma utsteinense]MBC3785517.1 TonB-linked SusC/RagA family outer membrane protein [Spirosoma utsteinense]MBC3791666.1 TonB-linked SusC/RagA family outer membrane protein [Spirosoma utsteinense]